MMHFTKTLLYTGADGRAQFREELVALGEGTPQAMLSEVFASGGYQLRHSPVGFRSSFHCTTAPQWCFILQGQMEIGLQGAFPTQERDIGDAVELLRRALADRSPDADANGQVDGSAAGETNREIVTAIGALVELCVA